jgi:hypothetical protein
MAVGGQNPLALRKETLWFSTHGRNREEIDGHAVKVREPLALPGLAPPVDGRRRIIRDGYLHTHRTILLVLILGIGCRAGCQPALKYVQAVVLRGVIPTGMEIRSRCGLIFVPPQGLDCALGRKDPFVLPPAVKIRPFSSWVQDNGGDIDCEDGRSAPASSRNEWAYAWKASEVGSSKV